MLAPMIQSRLKCTCKYEADVKTDHILRANNFAKIKIKASRQTKYVQVSFYNNGEIFIALI